MAKTPNIEVTASEPTVTIINDAELIDQKRGWVLDALVKVGHLEAAMSHGDEQISYLKEQLNHVQDEADLTKIVDEIGRNVDVMLMDYHNRVESLNEVFDTFNGDRHYYCQMKHRATAFVIACEIYHSRDCNPADETSMHKAAQALALTCSLAFGFEPFSCLRCLDEAMKQEYADKLKK